MSQIPSRRLLSFDRLEQRPEVPLAEAASAFALDDLVEHGRAILDRLREDLEQIAFRIAIDENAELLEDVQRFVDLADACLEIGVIGGGRAEELDAPFPERRH